MYYRWSVSGWFIDQQLRSFVCLVGQVGEATFVFDTLNDWINILSSYSCEVQPNSKEFVHYIGSRSWAGWVPVRLSILLCKLKAIWCMKSSLGKVYEGILGCKLNIYVTRVLIRHTWYRSVMGDLDLASANADDLACGMSGNWNQFNDIHNNPNFQDISDRRLIIEFLTMHDPCMFISHTN